MSEALVDGKGHECPLRPPEVPACAGEGAMGALLVVA